MLMGSLKKFMDYARWKEVDLIKPNFSLAYYTSIPEQLGFAGSSAIITACMKALCEYYDIKISPEVLANIVLSVETEELGIVAGLQDRVAQAFEKPVYMDFNENHFEQNGHGKYETFNPAILPKFYIAYKPKLSERSTISHSDLRGRYDSGDKSIVGVMDRLCELTDTFYRNIKRDDMSGLGDLMNENFDLRTSIMNVNDGNTEMVEIARSTGVSAKLTGSGGAIIGIYENDEQYLKLEEELLKIDARVIKPDIIFNTNT